MNTANVGRVITDFYCNGFAGRRYDLTGAVIIAEDSHYIVIRLLNGEREIMTFYDMEKDGEGNMHVEITGWMHTDKQKLIDKWCAVT